MAKLIEVIEKIPDPTPVIVDKIVLEITANEALAILAVAGQCGIHSIMGGLWNPLVGAFGNDYSFFKNKTVYKEYREVFPKNRNPERGF